MKLLLLVINLLICSTIANAGVHGEEQYQVCYEEYTKYAELYKSKKEWQTATKFKDLAEFNLELLRKINFDLYRSVVFRDNALEGDLKFLKPKEIKFKFDSIEELNYFCR